MTSISTQETPRFNVIEAFTSPIAWLIAVIIDLLLYFFSAVKLSWVVGVILIIAIIILIVVVHYFHFCIIWIKYSITLRKTYAQLQIITGEKQTEIIKLQSQLEGHPIQLLKYFLFGSYKGQAAISNTYHQNANMEIHILAKMLHNGELELLFDKGTNDGIEPEMLLSIVPKYYDQLWGVIRVIESKEANCKGIVVSSTNNAFWQQLIKDAETDVSPPSNISARFYKTKDLDFEIKTMQEIATPKKVQDNG